MSLTFGLGLLFALKYFDFFSDLAGKAIHALGYQATVPFMNLLLPVGISFYTFQSLSYTIDVWRGRIKPEKSIIRYAQYVSMFTQLLAGPIVKAREYLPALKERASHFIADHSHFTAALFLILTGLAKKTGADWLAGSIVDRVYESPQMFLPLETLAAVYAYGIQIYGDFSGYTDMAIGSAMLLGFNLTQNFHRPYASLSMTEFWQRWHMSLGKWLGDYLYISLGGNRKRVLFNIGVTMLLCGLWHGAGIPFMLWGLYHGLFLIIERIFGLNKKETKNRFLRGFRIFVTLHIVLFGWIIFRCGTWETFTGVLGSLAGGKWGAPNVGPLLLVVMTVFYALHYTPVAWKERLERAWAGLPASLQGLAASFITIVLYNAATAGIRPFIYFQF
ncbi:MAG TPA: MBOAT family O-acyltransferase [Spirochaetota bacterium]|nr:MBOAT family O-acyltransferase [Spirochaetota bacterium]